MTHSAPIELSTREIEAITRRKQRAAQVEALRSMGFTVVIRPDGSPLVARAHALQVLGVDASTVAQPVTLDLSSVHAS